MSGHGHGHGHASMPRPCWAREFVLKHHLPPGAPRRRRACRGITAPRLLGVAKPMLGTRPLDQGTGGGGGGAFSGGGGGGGGGGP
jgi:hypothetical protein